jgi:hypothetical protein
MYINSSFIHFVFYILVPGAINDLTVANVTSHSVQICWKEPCPSNGNITDYVVNVYLSDGTQRNTTETNELCQVFEKLLPYTYYSFNVTAKTKVVYTYIKMYQCFLLIPVFYGVRVAHLFSFLY